MKRLFDSCRRQRQSLCLLAGGMLSEPERSGVERHLAACAGCRKYFEEVQAVATSLSDYVETQADLQPRLGAQARWNQAIRAAGRTPPVRSTAPAGAVAPWWREVIWPWRRVWAGLAVVWLGIFAGNVSLPGPEPALSAKASPRSQEMLMSFRDQQRILAELLPDLVAVQDADRQRPYLPKPRTERAPVMAV
jgi:anti-sigma factor RsiW